MSVTEDISPSRDGSTSRDVSTGRTPDANAVDATWPGRKLNTWTEEPTDAADDEFDLCADIGPPRDSAVGADFKEPPAECWKDSAEINIRLVVSAMNAKFIPGWHDLKLRRTGRTATARFRVKTSVVGTITINLQVYLADKMLLIDEHRLDVAVSTRRKAA